MRKGFTLIELLAVIVILAIIALIATPIILGIINDAREDSNKRSVENYAHAVELAVARAATKQGGKIYDGLYTIDPDNKQIIYDQDSSIKIPVDYKGETIEGKVEVDAEGRIKLLSISLNGSDTKYSYTETDGVTKNEGENNYVSSPFKVTDDGILLHYERQGNETSVKVPAEVNGVKITSIATSAFVDGDAIFIGPEMLIIGLTEESKNYYKTLLEDIFGDEGARFVMIDEFGRGSDPVNLTSDIFFSSGIGKIYGEPEEDGSIIFSYEDESNYYLENIDLSEMRYLEHIIIGAFAGYNADSSSSSTIGLNAVKFPMDGNLKVIGVSAFEENNLTSIELPNTLTTVEEVAFRNNNITTVTIPASVTTLGERAFGDPSTVKVLGDSSRFDANWYEYFRNATKIIE